MAGIRPGGIINYKPTSDYVGTDTFTYEVCDDSGQCDEAMVIVTVEPLPNSPPVANDDFVTISEGMNPGPQIPVLVNDDDPDGDTLKVTGVGDPSNGAVAIGGDEEGVVYTPEEGFTGVDCKFGNGALVVFVVCFAVSNSLLSTHNHHANKSI